MLTGENIIFRTIEPKDIDCLLSWENDIENWKVSNTFVPFSRKLIEEYVYSAQDIFSAKQIRFIIEDKESENQLGCIDLFEYDPFHLRAGVGILIDKKHRNKGVAKEAIELLKKYSFKHLKLNQLYCSVGENNEASIQLFQQSEFVNTGIKKAWLNYGESWEDELFFQCLSKNQ